MLYDFDTTATSPVLPEVLTAYCRRLSEHGNNPSSRHAGGLAAASLLEDARLSIAKSLDCQPREVFFTSGATESINQALKGTAWAGRRLPKGLLTSRGEHEAVLSVLPFLEEEAGYENLLLPLEADGRVSRPSLEESLDQAPCGLVSLIAVNNETGSINDLEELIPIIRRKAAGAVIHSDIVQACGKLPFSFKASGLDLASVSGHKLGAPKGTGLLIKRKGLALEPLLHGGGQQSGLRSGTVDLPGALALAEALAIQTGSLEENLRAVEGLRTAFIEALKLADQPHILLSPGQATPYIMSIAFPGLRGETLMNALSAESIYISTGSACGSARAGQNHVLTAMGWDKKRILEAVRISFSPRQKIEDVRHLARRITDLYGRYALK